MLITLYRYSGRSAKGPDHPVYVQVALITWYRCSGRGARSPYGKGIGLDKSGYQVNIFLISP